MRDLHTNYLLPAPFALPHGLPAVPRRAVRRRGRRRDGAERYLVTKVAASLAHPTFVPEVEVLHWNGVPVRRAVEANARAQAGSNVDGQPSPAASTP